MNTASQHHASNAATAADAERLRFFAEEIAVLRQSVQAEFGGLSERELNWKPHKDKWSIAQCFEHLITADAMYFPAFDRILQRTHSPLLWQRLPLLPDIIGSLMVKNLERVPTRKFKTIAMFEPSQSAISMEIRKEFIRHLERVEQHLRAFAEMESSRVVISLPISPIIVLPVFDALTMIVNHEHRHLWQAAQVRSAVNFGIV